MRRVIAILVLILAAASLSACCESPCNQPNPCNPCQTVPVYASPCCP